MQGISPRIPEKKHWLILDSALPDSPEFSAFTQKSLGFFPDISVS